MPKRKKVLAGAVTRTSEVIPISSLRRLVVEGKALCNDLIAARKDLRELIGQVIKPVKKQSVK